VAISLEKIGYLMSETTKQNAPPTRERLLPILRSIGITTYEEAKALITEIMSDKGKHLLKEEADGIHAHLTSHLSSDQIAAVVANAIAAIIDLPDWEKIPVDVGYPLPKIR